MTKQIKVSSSAEFKVPTSLPLKLKISLKKKHQKLIEFKSMPLKIWMYPKSMEYSYNEGVKIFFDDSFTIIREPYDKKRVKEMNNYCKNHQLAMYIEKIYYNSGYQFEARFKIVEGQKKDDKNNNNK